MQTVLIFLGWRGSKPYSFDILGEEEVQTVLIFWGGGGPNHIDILWNKARTGKSHKIQGPVARELINANPQIKVNQGFHFAC